MKSKILPLLALNFLAFTGFSQTVTDPAITSWVVNTNGATGYNCSGCSPAHNGTITANVKTVYYTSANSFVTCSGVPSYNVGPWTSNPNVPSDQNKCWKITRTPAENTGTKTATALGMIGVWSNGVGIYNPKDGYYWDNGTSSIKSPGTGTWNRNAYVYEAVSFDACLGHADQSGSYHNHVNPKCLYDATASSAHSSIIGYAFDGFPIYGAFAYTNTDGTGAIKRMRSSYKLTTATTRTNGPNMTTSYSGSVYAAGSFCEDYVYTNGYGDLDAYNGRYCQTPEYPNGIYAYFVTTDTNGDPEFPFVIGTSYYGTVQSGNTGPSGGANTATGTQYIPSTVGLTEIVNPNSKISLYPNPISDNVIQFQTLDNSKDLNVKVIDYQGRILINRTFAASTYNSNVSIPAPYLNAGVYWVSFESNGTKEVKKVVLLEE
jgi:hypothetical protein